MHDAGHTAQHLLHSHYITPKNRRKVLKFCAQAAWRLGSWDELEKYASHLVQGNFGHGPLVTPVDPRGWVNKVIIERRFLYQALTLMVPSIMLFSAFIEKEWTLAADAIDEARKAMGSRFTALMAESYKRAYLSMVTAQTLAEMEETIEFRKLEERSIATGQRPPLNRPDKEETRNRVLLTWRRRLVGNRFDADVHASITAVRSLVLGPTDEVDPTVTLSNLYRQAQRYKLSERVLLDPLAKLGANLNGPVFGFGLPESLSLGLSRVENVNADQVIVNQLVCGDRYQ